MKRTGEKIQYRSRMKTWAGRVTTVHADGTREKSKWCVLGTDNRELAQKAYDRWLESGELPVAERGRITFAAAAERVMDAREASGDAEAKKRRERLRAYALPRIGMLSVGDIETHHVASVLDAMAKTEGKSEGYILKVRSDISQILAQLRREGAVSENVARTIPVCNEAKVDGRRRVRLSDEHILAFQQRRGFETQLDMMVLFSRWIGGHRTSDEHAGDWEDVDQEGYAWMRVRRPKTDGEDGETTVGRHRDRAYEMVAHEVPEDVRPHLRRWHERAGRPTSGPIFPLLRDAKSGPVRMKSGKLIERRGGKAGERKGGGNSYAAALRRAVWKAKLYLPLPGFDPARPDKSKCAYQTDTKTTRRLTFHSIRGAYQTAVVQAEGVNTQTALALCGLTQLSTQLKHYMGERTVRTPDRALPGGKPKAPPANPDVLAAFELIRAALAPGSGGNLGPAPERGAKEGGLALGESGKYSESLASPGGFEPPTRALGKRGTAPNRTQQRVNTQRVPARTSPSKGSQPQNVGQDSDALTAVRQAAAQAVAEGNWALADQLRALLTPPPGVASLDEARTKRGKR